MESSIAVFLMRQLACEQLPTSWLVLGSPLPSPFPIPVPSLLSPFPSCLLLSPFPSCLLRSPFPSCLLLSPFHCPLSFPLSIPPSPFPFPVFPLPLLFLILSPFLLPLLLPLLLLPLSPPLLSLSPPLRLTNPGTAHSSPLPSLPHRSHTPLITILVGPCSHWSLAHHLGTLGPCPPPLGRHASRDETCFMCVPDLAHPVVWNVADKGDI